MISLSSSDPIETAKRAILAGSTRKQFIRAASDGGAEWLELQEWSDAYSEAVRQLKAVSA